MTGLIEKIILGLSFAFGVKSRKIDAELSVTEPEAAREDTVQPAFSMPPMFQMALAAAEAQVARAGVTVDAAAEDLAQVSIAEPAVAEAAALPAPAANRQRSFRLSMRLRIVAKVQSRKRGAKAKPAGKGRANLKPKPVVAAAKTTKHRSPSLFPTKVKPVAPKRAKTKIYIEKRPKLSAQILKFPVRKPLPSAPRLKRAA